MWCRAMLINVIFTFFFLFVDANGESLLPLTASTPDPPQSMQTGEIYGMF